MSDEHPPTVADLRTFCESDLDPDALRRLDAIIDLIVAGAVNFNRAQLLQISARDFGAALVELDAQILAIMRQVHDFQSMQASKNAKGH
jgi:hypothetical protein